MNERDLIVIEKLGLKKEYFRPNKITVEEKIIQLEEQVNNLTQMQNLLLNQLDEHQYEVIKEGLPSGDYTNPIKWESGMNIESGKWYYFNDIELPYECIKSGNPKDINNVEYFDFI